jgi:hypothetical protein
MKLTKVPAILGILTTAVAVGGWMHSHAEATIEAADLKQRRLIDMNTAEFQLFKAKQELERLILKPASERTEYDTFELDLLIEDVDHWKNRVREIESA